MSDEDEKLNWNIELNFDLQRAKPETRSALPPKPRIAPKDLVQQKFPRIAEKIALLWGSLELHKYFEQTLFADRQRQGFPFDVMEAMGELHDEHQRILMQKGLLRRDVWDLQFGGPPKMPSR